jgi:hypothetical protein
MQPQEDPSTAAPPAGRNSASRKWPPFMAKKPVVPRVRKCPLASRRHKPSRGILPCIFAAALLLFSACTRPEVNDSALLKAQRTASQIHTNMTFRQVSSILPVMRNDIAPVRTHGGVWYQVPLQGGYYLEVRFSHPRDSDDIQESYVNFPPVLQVNLVRQP